MSESLIIESTDTSGKKLRKVISDLNPGVSHEVAKNFAQQVTALTTGTYNSSTRVGKNSLTGINDLKTYGKVELSYDWDSTSEKAVTDGQVITIKQEYFRGRTDRVTRMLYDYPTKIDDWRFAKTGRGCWIQQAFGSFFFRFYDEDMNVMQACNNEEALIRINVKSTTGKTVSHVRQLDTGGFDSLVCITFISLCPDGNVDDTIIITVPEQNGYAPFSLTFVPETAQG